MAGQRVGSVSLLALLATSVGSCARRAPGPEACVQFAERWFQVNRQDMIPDHPLTKHFDAKIQACLTKPYDRDLVECVMTGGDTRRCLRAYERRLLVGKRSEGS